MRAYFLILSFIILVSGCVNPLGGGSSAGGGPGVVLNSFSFSPSSIKSNQLTKLSLSIENQGDYVVEDGTGTVYLFNLPNDWTISDKSDIPSNTEPFGLLAPQVRGVQKYSGESMNFEWVLRAPTNLPKDEIFSYIAQARVCYPYKTKVWGRLEVVSEDAWLQDPPAEHAVAVQQTQGPLKVELISKQPLMVETDVRIKIRITNVGDGVVTSNDCSVFATISDDADDTRINNLNRINLGESDCTFVESENLYLKKGQSKETYIVCTPPSLGSNPITTSDFTMELEYNYYSDRKATVRVTGTSEDASGGMIVGGGGAVSVISLKDPCSSACKATGQVYTAPIGMCASTATSTVKYPGTTVDVVIEPLIDARESLSTILGSDYSKATIKTLGLHDVTAGDLNLQSMTVGMLDTKTTSIQYEKAKLYPKTAGTVGIVDYLCSSAISDSMMMTLDGKTKVDVCPNAIKSQPLSNMHSINGVSGSDFKDRPLSGLTITSIVNRDISTMTGGNLTAINVEDFKVLQISGVLASAPRDVSTGDYYLQYVKCTSSNTLLSGPSSICQCVIGVGSDTYEPFDGEPNAACNAECIKQKAGFSWIDGGVCNTAAVYKAGNDVQCSGTTTYTYRTRLMPDPNPCTVPKDNCYCYDRVTISSAAAALLCK